MSDFIFTVSIWVIAISTVLRLDAAYHYLKVIKRAREEAGVKNGLEVLRKQLLAIACILFFMDTVGLLLIVFKPIVDPFIYQRLLEVITIANSLGFDLVSRIKDKMYTQQYTPANKAIHAQMAQKERAKGGGTHGRKQSKT